MSGFALVSALEWRRAVQRRRLFFFNVAIPLLLVLPISLSSAPRVHAAAVYTVLFAFFGTFGAAIPLLRDAERGMVRRMARTPLGARNIIWGRTAVGAAIDALQLLPALMVILVTKGAFNSTALTLVAALFVSLVLANFIGFWVAALARSVAEGALFAAVAALLLLHASGVFRTPAVGTVGARIESVSPYRALHELLLAGPGVSHVHFGGLFLGLGAVFVFTALLAGRLIETLAQLDGRT